MIFCVSQLFFIRIKLWQWQLSVVDVVTFSSCVTPKERSQEEDSWSSFVFIRFYYITVLSLIWLLSFNFFWQSIDIFYDLIIILFYHLTCFSAIRPIMPITVRPRKHLKWSLKFTFNLNFNFNKSFYPSYFCSAKKKSFIQQFSRNTRGKCVRYS